MQSCCCGIESRNLQPASSQNISAASLSQCKILATFCLVTHEQDCDVELIWFFARHLLWWNSSVWRSTTVCQWWVSPSSLHLHGVLTIRRVLIRPCSDEVLVDTSPASLQLFLFLSPLLPNSQMPLLHVFEIPLDYICLRARVNQIIFVWASLLTFLGNFGTSHHFTVSEALARWACLRIEPAFQSAWVATLSHACSPYAPPTTVGLVQHLVLWQCGFFWTTMMSVLMRALPDLAATPSCSNGGKEMPG